ncbi:MAG: hypothetical protein U0930_24095 [Pirellulales bacterium]
MRPAISFDSDNISRNSLELQVKRAMGISNADVADEVINWSTGTAPPGPKSLLMPWKSCRASFQFGCRLLEILLIIFKATQHPNWI